MRGGTSNICHCCAHQEEKQNESIPDGGHGGPGGRVAMCVVAVNFRSLRLGLIIDIGVGHVQVVPGFWVVGRLSEWHCCLSSSCMYRRVVRSERLLGTWAVTNSRKAMRRRCSRERALVQDEQQKRR